MKNLFFGEQCPPGSREIISISPKTNPMVRDKILSFGKLRDGWDFGQGVPAPQHVVKAALMFYGLGEHLGLEMDAFPGAGGDISVDFYIGEELVQVLIDTDLSLELTHERGIGSHYDELAYCENIYIDEVINYLINFRAKGYESSWSSPGFYTETSTSPGISDSILTASKNLMELSRSSKLSAFKILEQKYVSTFDSIPPLRMANHLLFG
jgi:hypothetical protein